MVETQAFSLSLIWHGMKTELTDLDSTGVNWFPLCAPKWLPVLVLLTVEACEGYPCNKEQWRAEVKWKQLFIMKDENPFSNHILRSQGKNTWSILLRGLNL